MSDLETEDKTSNLNLSQESSPLITKEMPGHLEKYPEDPTDCRTSADTNSTGSKVIESDPCFDEASRNYHCFPSFEEAKEQAVHLAERIWECAHFRSLPEWLQDNEFLHGGHRPQLPSISACVLSVFRIHTETGNIWSHFLGCLLFAAITAYIYTRPHHEIHLEKKFVFMPFLLGAIVCMAFSSAFHTMYCHSERVNKLFLKLDYVGISLLIMGSFIPWLYYSFYCRVEPKIVYISLIMFMGIACIWVSFCETFSTPSYRPFRAGLFAAFGCCGVIPCVHYFITEGVHSAFTEAAFGWLILMAATYIIGALLYAFRIPERFFPGKCDIWFQSHQLFHLLVVVASFINYHGINVLSGARLNGKTCEELEKMKCDVFSFDNLQHQEL